MAAAGQVGSLRAVPFIAKIMCLIIAGIAAHPTYALVIAANRDEFYARPAQPARFWQDAPHVLAGRDETAGGTWMGVTRSGRWAALTNYRAPNQYAPEAPSRGALVADYLTGSAAPRTYAADVQARAERFNGFNLLVGRGAAAYYVSNQIDDGPRAVGDGWHGLSNAVLDTPWPKVERGLAVVPPALAADDPVAALLQALNDRTRAPDEELPDTGVGRAEERLLSPMFIASDEYGTRCSTVLLLTHDGRVHFAERTYNRGARGTTRRFSFQCTQPPQREPADASDVVA